MAWPVGEVVIFDNVVAVRLKGQSQIDQHSELQFDFSTVKQSDSSALSLMLAWKRYAGEQSKTVSFEKVPVSLVTLATICNVASILGIEK
jgi:phospholipid transport system transporter-binding protein